MKIRKLSNRTTQEIFFQLTKTIVGLLFALVIIRFYVFQPFTISGTSMEPSFFHGEYLIVEEFSYNFSAPKRGDVIVFRHPEPDCDDHINSNYINRKFFQGACSNYIKRVIGLPGETVTIREGKVAVDGEALEETYIPKNIPTLGNQTVVLAEDEFFVLGDNRNPNASSDSREWGALPKTHIVGRALVILLPPQKFGVVDRIEF